MPTLTIPNSFSNGGTIQASEHNANFNAIATLLNSTKLDADNLQDSAVTTAKIADGDITTAKIEDSAVTLAKIASAVQAFLVPTGTIAAYGGSSLPTGWLPCDGAAVSRSTYSTLFTALSTTWGAGDGSTTFNVPDLRGRTLIGDGTGAGLTARTLGTQNIGAETHTLITAEIPAHNHNEQFHAAGGGAGTGIAGDAAVQTPFPANNLPTQDTGGGGAHNNMQPSAVVKYMIKT